MNKEIKIGKVMLPALSHDDAVKHLWEAQETTTKALKTLSKNLASRNIQNLLFETLSTLDSSLKWIQHLRIGSYYKVSDYNDHYYICRLETFFAGNVTIECYCRVLTSTKDEINYTKIQDFIGLAIPTLEHKEFELNLDELPLYTSNIFNGSLYTELLK